VPTDHADLPQLARRIFSETLNELDAARTVRRAVTLDGSRLKIFDAEFDTRALDIYSIALGKAACAMAAALDEILGARLREGVITAPPLQTPLPPRWLTFAGGHPLPNDASLQAARAAFDLLRRADERAAHATGSKNARVSDSNADRVLDGGNVRASDDDGSRVLVIFLVSGGGSAMLELPRGTSITLEDLRAMNRSLVMCGAGIAEINAVRRAVSAVKGGGLSRVAPRTAQVSLIISDVGSGEESAVASGPTFTTNAARDARDARAVVERYDLGARLPASVIRAIARPHEQTLMDANVPQTNSEVNALRRHFVLLDNARAVEHAAESARRLGFAVEIVRDLVEQNVAEGARLLVSRLLELSERTDEGRGVCVVSGGEFACPVRGGGVGGRNSETVLRCALELDALRAGSLKTSGALPRIVALSAGTDGIDGNSPAAGALCDETTIARAHALGLDAQMFLDASDSYAFFDALGDTLTTGATGTNVRDLRILLMKDEG
jgi:glycerate 2-kinase